MQEISLNPQKLAGQCSKLKCCLIYELDAYMDARKEFPRIYNPLEALDGTFYHVKNDIFAGIMYFSPASNGAGVHIPLPVERGKEIIRLNKQGQKVDKLEDTAAAPREQTPDFQNGMGEDSITRFDPARRSGRGRGGRGRDRDRNSPSRAPGADAAPKPEGKPQPGKGRDQGKGQNQNQRPARKPDREKPARENTDPQQGAAPRGGRPPRRNNRNRKPQNHEPS
jgi:hypothetical protein